MNNNINIFHNQRRLDTEKYVYSSKDEMIQDYISRTGINNIQDKRFIEELSEFFDNTSREVKTHNFPKIGYREEKGIIIETSMKTNSA